MTHSRRGGGSFSSRRRNTVPSASASAAKSSTPQPTPRFRRANGTMRLLVASSNSGASSTPHSAKNRSV